MSAAPALLVTRDDALLDDVLRLAAAAGTTLDVAHDATSALRGWSAAGLVLVGADLAPALATQSPSRRSAVHVVVSGHAGDGLFRSALGVGAVDVVELPAGDAWLVELLTDAADGESGQAPVLGVVAGSGGAGATTFAVALGLTAARVAPAVLLDLDALGPGVDRVVGLGPESGVGIGWDALVGSRGRLGSRSLREALPRRAGLAVVTWRAGVAATPDAVSVREVLSAARRGHDLVVVDLPRQLDEVAVEVVARCDTVLMVVEATVPSVASAGRVAEQLRPWSDRLGVVVRGGGSLLSGDQVAVALGMPLLAEVPRHRRLAEHLDLGLGPVHSPRSPLARAARQALTVVDQGHAA